MSLNPKSTERFGMLDILRKLVHDIDAAPTLIVALDVIVQSVKDALKTEVCSIYLLDERSSRYVLMATQGLNAEGWYFFRAFRRLSWFSWPT